MTTIKKNSADQSVRLIAIIGILIFANILGISWFARVDMTGDNQFTLNRASKRIVSDLKDPVTVKAYFTDNLPPPYSNNRRYVKDLLDEYYAASDGKFRYEFIDPKAEETEEDKEKKKEVKHDIFGRAVREATSIERELRTLGIQEVNVQVLEDDRRETQRAYMGLAINYGDASEVIPLVQDTSNLEYNITVRVRKLVRESPPKIAFVTTLPESPLLHVSVNGGRGTSIGSLWPARSLRREDWCGFGSRQGMRHHLGVTAYRSVNDSAAGLLSIHAAARQSRS